MVKVQKDTQRVDTNQASLPNGGVDRSDLQRRQLRSIASNPAAEVSNKSGTMRARNAARNEQLYDQGALNPGRPQTSLVNKNVSADLTKEMARDELNAGQTIDAEEEERVRRRRHIRSALSLLRSRVPAETLEQLQRNLEQQQGSSFANTAQLKAAAAEVLTKLQGDLVANIRMGDRSEREAQVEFLTEAFEEALRVQDPESKQEPDLDKEAQVSSSLQLQLGRQALIDAKLIAAHESLKKSEPILALAEVFSDLPLEYLGEFQDQYTKLYGVALKEELEKKRTPFARQAIESLLKTGQLSDRLAYGLLEERAVSYGKILGSRKSKEFLKGSRLAQLEADFDNYKSAFSEILAKNPALVTQLQRTVNHTADSVRAGVLASLYYEIGERAMLTYGLSGEDDQGYREVLRELETYKQQNQDFFIRHPELEAKILGEFEKGKAHVKAMFAKVNRRADSLMHEMDGLGTDDMKVVRLLSGLNPREMYYLKLAFKRFGQGTLKEWVKSDVSNGVFSYTGYRDRALRFLNQSAWSMPLASQLDLTGYFKQRDPLAQTEAIFSRNRVEQLATRVHLAIQGDTAAFDLHLCLRNLSPEDRSLLERHIKTTQGKSLNELVIAQVNDEKTPLQDRNGKIIGYSTSERELALSFLETDQIDYKKLSSYISAHSARYALRRAGLLAEGRPDKTAATLKQLESSHKKIISRLQSQFRLKSEYIEQFEKIVKETEEKERLRLVKARIIEFSTKIGMERGKRNVDTRTLSRLKEQRKQYRATQRDLVGKLVVRTSKERSLEQKLRYERAQWLDRVQDRAETRGENLFLSCEKSVGKIEEAMFGGFDRVVNCFGTYKDEIYKVLENKSQQERSLIIQLYREQFERSLRYDFMTEMSGVDLDRAVALMEGRKADAIAAEAYQALSGYWGADTDDLRVAVAKLDNEAERKQFNTSFEEKYMERLEGLAGSRANSHSKGYAPPVEFKFNSFQDTVEYFLGQAEADIVMAEYSGDKLNLAIAEIAENLDRFNIAEEELAFSVERTVVDPKTGSIDAEKLRQFLNRYKKNQGKSLEEAILEAKGETSNPAVLWLRTMIACKPDGKPASTREQVAAAKLYWAMKGAGADKDRTRQALLPESLKPVANETQSAREKRLADYQQYINGVQDEYYRHSGGNRLVDDIEWNYFAAYEDSFKRIIKSGEYDELCKLREAIGSSIDGVDVELVKEVLANKTAAEINQIASDFRSQYGMDLFEELEYEVNGSKVGKYAMKMIFSTPGNAFFGGVKKTQDWLDVEMMLKGDFSDVKPGTKAAVAAVLEIRRQIQTRRNYDRSGWAWGQDFVTAGKGKRLDEESKEAVQYIDQALEGGITAEELKRIKSLLKRNHNASDQFRDSRDAIAQSIADTGTAVVLTGTCVVVTIGSGGAGAPVAVLIVSGAAASGAIRYGTKTIICGDSYSGDTSKQSATVVYSLIDGASMGIGAGMGSKASATAAEKIGGLLVNEGMEFTRNGVTRVVTEVTEGTVRATILNNGVRQGTPEVIEGLTREVGEHFIHRHIATRLTLGAGVGAVDGGVSAFAMQGASTAMDQQTYEEGFLQAAEKIFRDSARAVPDGVQFGAGLGSLFSIRQPKHIRMSRELNAGQVSSLSSEGYSTWFGLRRIKVPEEQVQRLLAQKGAVTVGDVFEHALSTKTVKKKKARKWITQAEAQGNLEPGYANQLRTRLEEGTLNFLELAKATGRNPYEHLLIRHKPKEAPVTSDSSVVAAQNSNPKPASSTKPAVETTAPETTAATTNEVATTQVSESTLLTQAEIEHRLSQDPVTEPPSVVDDGPVAGSWKEAQAQRRGPQEYDKFLEQAGRANEGPAPMPQAELELAPKSQETTVLYADEVAPTRVAPEVSDTPLLDGIVANGNQPHYSLDDLIENTNVAVSNKASTSLDSQEIPQHIQDQFFRDTAIDPDVRMDIGQHRNEVGSLSYQDLQSMLEAHSVEARVLDRYMPDRELIDIAAGDTDVANGFSNSASLEEVVAATESRSVEVDAEIAEKVEVLSEKLGRQTQDQSSVTQEDLTTVQPVVSDIKANSVASKETATAIHVKREKVVKLLDEAIDRLDNRSANLAVEHEFSSLYEGMSYRDGELAEYDLRNREAQANSDAVQNLKTRKQELSQADLDSCEQASTILSLQSMQRDLERILQALDNEVSGITGSRASDKFPDGGGVTGTQSAVQVLTSIADEMSPSLTKTFEVTNKPTVKPETNQATATSTKPAVKVEQKTALVTEVQSEMRAAQAGLNALEDSVNYSSAPVRQLVGVSFPVSHTETVAEDYVVGHAYKLTQANDTTTVYKDLTQPKKSKGGRRLAAPSSSEDPADSKQILFEKELLSDADSNTYLEFEETSETDIPLVDLAQRRRLLRNRGADLEWGALAKEEWYVKDET